MSFVIFVFCLGVVGEVRDEWGKEDTDGLVRVDICDGSVWAELLARLYGWMGRMLR